MSINYIYDQNILTFKVQVIAHQCNCTSKTGKGLYIDIIKKFPHADIYKTREKDSIPGTIKLTGNEKGKTKIIAMFAQLFPGKPSVKETSKMREQWFVECLNKMSKIKNLKSIAFPYHIGCGLAQGNWNNYKKLIENFASQNPNTQVYIVSNEIESDKSSSNEENSDSIVLGSSESEEKNSFSEEEIIVKNNKQKCYISPKVLYKDGIKNISLKQKDRLEKNGYWEFFEEMIEDKVLDNIDKTIMKEKEDIFPIAEEVFNSLLITPLNNVKAVIIAQDPYFIRGAAMGLAFSHHDTYGTIQPSLRNIYKELESNGFKVDKSSGNLMKWAEQGVLLLNASLTVKEGKENANCHANIWNKDKESFSPRLLQFISRKRQHFVALLWGAFAQKLGEANINKEKHYLLKAGHPSPVNTAGGFLECKHFIKTNVQLKKWNMKEIDWNLA